VPAEACAWPGNVAGVPDIPYHDLQQTLSVVLLSDCLLLWILTPLLKRQSLVRPLWLLGSRNGNKQIVAKYHSKAAGAFWFKMFASAWLWQ